MGGGGSDFGGDLEKKSTSCPVVRLPAGLSAGLEVEDSAPHCSRTTEELDPAHDLASSARRLAKPPRRREVGKHVNCLNMKFWPPTLQPYFLRPSKVHVPHQRPQMGHSISLLATKICVSSCE